MAQYTARSERLALEASSVSSLTEKRDGEHSFINVTGDPAIGRDHRRTTVKRTVMSNYHKLRKTCAGPSRLAHSNIPRQSDSRATTVERQRRPGLSVQRFSLLPSPQPYATRLFQRKQWTDIRDAQLSNTVLQFVCNQTARGAQDMASVCFIHRHFRDLTDDTTCSKSGSPLARCQDLLCIYNQLHYPLGRQLNVLWGLVHEHQEWMFSQYNTMGKWDLLNACQALTLYLLLWIRSNPGCAEKAFPFGGVAMLYTLGRLIKTIQSRHLYIDETNAVLYPARTWRSWVYQESCVRVANIYFILATLVSVDIGFPCNGPTDWNIGAMPIPAAKSMWEADTESSWIMVPHRDMGPKEQALHNRAMAYSPPHRSLTATNEDLDEMGLVFCMARNLASRSTI